MSPVIILNLYQHINESECQHSRRKNKTLQFSFPTTNYLLGEINYF